MHDISLDTLTATAATTGQMSPPTRRNAHASPIGRLRAAAIPAAKPS